MKKYITMAIVALILVGCSKEDEPIVKEPEVAKCNFVRWQGRIYYDYEVVNGIPTWTASHVPYTPKDTIAECSKDSILYGYESVYSYGEPTGYPYYGDYYEINTYYKLQ